MKNSLKVSISYFVILTNCLFFSCSKDIIPDQKTIPLPQVEANIPNIKPKGTEKYLTKNSEYIYDQNVVRTYNLIIRNDDYSKLNNDPTKEEYVPAALVLEGDTISPIGVRYKGSIGGYAGCVSGPDWRNPSGSKTCVKLSLQLKINWEGRKERFFDLNKLQFHAQNYDKSQLRERVGYWLFNQMGVPAPRAVHARLLINGQYSGLYGLIEEIDNRFIEYFYKNGKGNVLKEIWPIQTNGLPQEELSFRKALKTNEGQDTDISLMKEFSNSIANSIEANSKELTTKYMDVKSIMSYIVVDRGIRHDDGPFHWFCDNSNPCYNHNYYWFEDQKNKKVHIIPWDLDGAFEHVIWNNNPVTPIIDKWGVISNDCQPYPYGNPYFNQKSAACDKLTASWVKFDKEFLEQKKYFQEKILTDELTIKQIDFWANQLKTFINEADFYYNNGIRLDANKKATPFASWEIEVNNLKNQIRVARNLKDF